MTTRRLLLVAAFGTLALSRAPMRAAYAQAAVNGPQASTFVKKLLTDVIAVVNGGGGADGKRAKLQSLVDNAVDVTGVARFCLGRYWRQASAAQQQEYLGLFHKILMNNITGRIGDYQGVTFKMGGTTPNDGGVSVATTISRPNNAPNDVQWIVEQVGGGPRIVDVMAEGTSLRLTQRSDYASFLGRNNGDIAALIAALKRQAS